MPVSCHLVILSYYHLVIMSSCHLVIMSSCKTILLKTSACCVGLFCIKICVEKFHVSLMSIKIFWDGSINVIQDLLDIRNILQNKVTPGKLSGIWRNYRRILWKSPMKKKHFAKVPQHLTKLQILCEITRKTANAEFGAVRKLEK